VDWAAGFYCSSRHLTVGELSLLVSTRFLQRSLPSTSCLFGYSSRPLSRFALHTPGKWGGTSTSPARPLGLDVRRSFHLPALPFVVAYFMSSCSFCLSLPACLCNRNVWRQDHVGPFLLGPVGGGCLPACGMRRPDQADLAAKVYWLILRHKPLVFLSACSLCCRPCE